jgi:tRNA (guanine10-N2)-methyltransferase
MRDLPAEEAAKQIEEANQITVGKVFRALIRMPIPKSLGETERQYRVVVELDRDLYRFKYVDASLLGKRY